MKNLASIFVITTILVILMCAGVNAQDSVLISYQGRLTSDLGEPSNGSFDITFGIYAMPTGVSLLWSETHSGIAVSDGLFSVILGSQTALPDSIFSGHDRYLGITVGADPEISPRTLFTSVPSAVYARRVAGDIVTDDGILLINTLARDSAFLFDAGLTPRFTMYLMEPSAKQPMIEMNTSSDIGGRISIFNTDPIERKSLVELSGSPSGNASFKMFNPQPEPPALLFDINANAVDGARMSIYDEIGQVMGFEPMPFNEGYAMKFIDPGDDGKLMELVGNHMTNEAGIYLIDPGDDGHTISLTSSGSNGGSFKMFNPQPEPPALMFDVNADVTNGARMGFYNEFGAIMTAGPNPGGGFVIKMNDEEEQPIQQHVELGSSFSIPAKKNMASDGGYLSLYSPTDYLQTHLTPGNLTMYHEIDAIPGPSIKLEATQTTARLGLGTSILNEPISIGSDLGAYYGEFVQIGNNDGGRYSGFMCGEDLNNRGTIMWINSSNTLRLGGKYDGVDYGATLVIHEDQVAINTITPGTQELYVAGDIYATGEILAFSDGDAKTNVETIDGALDIVERLRGVRYNLKPEIAEEYKATKKTQVGLIAQEVEEVLPEVVNSPEEGYKSLNYSRLTAVLIEAIKELKAENDGLKAQLENQDSSESARIDELEKQLGQLLNQMKTISENINASNGAVIN
jgi:hypothetical protein